jgi:hypothetical protein
MLSPSQGTPETVVRMRLRELGDLAATLRDGLLTARDSLPVSPREDVMLLGEEEVDFPTEARRTIECAVVDHVEPLIRTLYSAADYKPDGQDE